MTAGLLQLSRLPVRFCRPLCALLIQRRPGRSFRSLPRTFKTGLEPGTQATSTISKPWQVAQASSDVSMTDGYKHELQAACEAVRLAARLCTVRYDYGGIASFESSLLSVNELLTQYLLYSQKVQLQLKAGEKQDKSDDSPVTIADYGER